MKIESPEQLEALLKVLNRNNVHRFELDGLNVQLTPVNPDQGNRQPGSPLDPNDMLSQMTEEEILMWSSGRS